MNLNSDDITINPNIDIESATYGEFSLSSLDIILDRIAQEIIRSLDDDDDDDDNDDDSIVSLSSPFSTASSDHRSKSRTLKLMDIGSGCGRLVLYMAIAQPPRLQQYYNNIVVVGIEQSKALYEESIRATERLLLHNNITIIHRNTSNVAGPTDDTVHTYSNIKIRLYCGSATDFMTEIQTADVIVCYSTAFASGNFDPSLSALLLSDEWNTILTPPSPLPSPSPSPSRTKIEDFSTTSSKTISQSPLYCVTMDKALDPRRGWTMIDRIEVPNPEIGVDSTAFLQKNDRKSIDWKELGQ
jgi:hypothetical protein